MSSGNWEKGRERKQEEQREKQKDRERDMGKEGAGELENDRRGGNDKTE